MYENCEAYFTKTKQKGNGIERRKKKKKYYFKCLRKKTNKQTEREGREGGRRNMKMQKSTEPFFNSKNDKILFCIGIFQEVFLDRNSEKHKIQVYSKTLFLFLLFFLFSFV